MGVYSFPKFGENGLGFWVYIGIMERKGKPWASLKGYIGLYRGNYWSYIGIMDKKMGGFRVEGLGFGFSV